MRAYMKNRFDFFGIPAPERRAAVKPLAASWRALDSGALLACARQLWLRPERECHYVAVDMLADRAAILVPTDIDALLALVRTNAWWDTVDGLTPVIGSILHQAEPRFQRAMDDALVDPDMWVRRVAMLHQKSWRGRTNTERLFGYATTLAPETEFFIRKAIGWALRDYARHDPGAVARFLQAERHRLSPLSLREAGKHLAVLEK